MNREQQFDELLQAWMDDGADVAPERFVLLAIGQAERTPQRGPWHATLEGLIMRLQPAAPILGVAAIAIAAIALYAVFSSSNVGNTAPTPIPTPSPITTERLPNLVLADENAPAGLQVTSTLSGWAAFVAGLPPGETLSRDGLGFLDARETELVYTGSDRAVATWAAVFESAEGAVTAYGFVAHRHEAPEGWGLGNPTRVPALGDDAVMYRGPAYGTDEATIYLWRVNNVVLAAIGVGGTADAAVLEIAGAMNASALE